MRKAYTLEDLIKVAQAQAEEEKPQGEKSDEELKEEEKKKKEEVPPEEEETKTSALKDLAEGLRATATWLDKVAQGPVAYSEPSAGGSTGEGGQVSVATPPTGEQTLPSSGTGPDATDTSSTGKGGEVPNTETEPLAGQTQAQPGNSTATETGKTSSGTTEAKGVLAEKVSALAGIIRGLAKAKTAGINKQAYGELWTERHPIAAGILTPYAAGEQRKGAVAAHGEEALAEAPWTVRHPMLSAYVPFAGLHGSIAGGDYLKKLEAQQGKTAAEPIDVPAQPAGDPPEGGGDVGYTAPTELSGLLGGDVAATNLTPQQAQQSTQNPDIAPLLAAQPETHAEGGDGAPNVDAKIGSWQQRLLSIIQGGE